MKYILTLLLIASMSTVNAQFFEAWPAKVKFDNKSQDLGTVKMGSTTQVAFPFINDGTEPFIIMPYKGGTEDINVILPKEPVGPGGKSQVIVEFRANQKGNFKQHIELITNAQKKPLILQIYGVVEK